MSLASKFGNRVRPISKESYNNNKQENRRAQRKSNLFKEGAVVFKPRPDTQEQVRMLPFLDHDYFVRPIKAHYEMGADKSSFPCPKTKGEPCDVCDYGSKMWAEGKQDFAKKLWSKDAAIVYIVDRAHEDHNPCILKLSFTNEKTLRERMENKKTHEIMPVNDLEIGHDLFFTLTDTGKKLPGNSNSLKELSGLDFDRDATPLGTEKQVGKWIDFMEENPILDQLNWLSNSEMLKIAGIDIDDDEDDDSEQSDDDDAPEREAEEAPTSTNEDEESEAEEDKAPPASSKKSEGLSQAERLAALRNRIGRK